MDFRRLCPLYPLAALKGQTDFVNYFGKYSMYGKSCETKNKVHKKLYK